MEKVWFGLEERKNTEGIFFFLNCNFLELLRFSITRACICR